MEPSASYPQLFESIEQHGAILPVYTHAGQVLDGSKRSLCCFQLGREIKRVDIVDPAVAAQLLYALHPLRAHDQFARELSLMQAARLLGAPPKEIVALRRVPKARPKYRAPNLHTTEVRARVPERLSERLAQLLTDHSCNVQELIVALIESADEDSLSTSLTRQRYVVRIRAPRK